MCSDVVGWFAMGFFGFRFCWRIWVCCYGFGWGLWPVVVVGDLGLICSGGGCGFRCGGVFVMDFWDLDFVG